MEKFIPYEKLSKKEKRKRDAMLRNTWGPLNPVTRKSKNPKAYDRQKARSGSTIPCPCLLLFPGKKSLRPPLPSSTIGKNLTYREVFYEACSLPDRHERQ